VQPTSALLDAFDLKGLDAAYGDWLDLRFAYSPNWPRIVPHAGVVNGPSISTELNLAVPLNAHLSATAGTGYAHQGGAGAADYAYWGVSAAYELEKPLAKSTPEYYNVTG